MNTGDLAGFPLFIYGLGYAIFLLLVGAAMFAVVFAVFMVVNHVWRGRAALRENEELQLKIMRAGNDLRSLEAQLAGRDVEIETLRHLLGDTRGSYRGELGEGSGKVAGEKPEGRAVS